MTFSELLMTGHNLCVYHVFVVAEKRVYIMLLNPLIVVTPSMIVTWLAKKKKKKKYDCHQPNMRLILLLNFF